MDRATRYTARAAALAALAALAFGAECAPPPAPRTCASPDRCSPLVAGGASMAPPTLAACGQTCANVPFDFTP